MRCQPGMVQGVFLNADMKKFSVLILISAMLVASFSCSKPEKEDPIKPDPVKPDPTPTPDPDPQPPTIDFTKASLGELAAKKGVKLGAAVTYWEYRNNPQVKDILKREFDAVTFGNEMKHDAIVNASGKFNFSSADEMVSWMKECGVDLFGHTLGWHQQQQIPYMNSLIAKASDNSESLLKANWNFESGTLDNYTADGFSVTEVYTEVFGGNYSAKATKDGSTLSFTAPVQEGSSYVFSFWAKGPKGAQLSFTSDDGQSVSTAVSDSWLKYSVEVPAGTSADPECLITADSGVIVDNLRIFGAGSGSGDDPGDEPSGYINPYALGGGIDFEKYTAGTTAADLLADGFTQINGPDYVKVSGDFANSGSLSLRMDNSDGHATESWDVQVITPSWDIEGGKTYRVAWYARSNEGADLQIDIRLESGVSYYSSVYNQFPKMTSDWTYQWVDIGTKESDSSIQVAFYGATQAALYHIDDIQVFDTVHAEETSTAAKGLKPNDLPAFKTTSSLDGETADDALGFVYKNWVYTMIEHFDAYGWDVVNETFTENGQFRSKSNTTDDKSFIWGTYFGGQKNFVDKAFAYAKDALSLYGKTADLYINDYNLETSPSKRKALCDYAASNPDITGVGSQMHLDMKTPDLQNKIVQMLKDMVATGKKVRISELDIKCTGLDAQAELYKFIFEQYIELVPDAQKGGITMWGINDKDSWVGENNHPLLWMGSGYTRKPAYEALYVYLCKLNGIDPYKN